MILYAVAFVGLVVCLMYILSPGGWSALGVRSTYAGRWLCRRGWHRFVRHWTVAPPGLATSTWHLVCTRPGCGQEWKLVRDAWAPVSRGEANNTNFRLLFGSDAQRAAEKERLFAERFGSTPRSILKVTGLSQQQADRLLQEFQKKFPLVAKARYDRPEKGRAYPYRYDPKRHNRRMREAHRVLSSLDWYDQTRGGNAESYAPADPEGPGFRDLVRVAEAMARASGRRVRR